MEILIFLFAFIVTGAHSINGDEDRYHREYNDLNGTRIVYLQKYPDQAQNLKDAPEWMNNCEWVIPDVPSSLSCKVKF